MGDFVSEKETTDSLPLFKFASLPKVQLANNEGERDHVIDDFTLYSVVSHSDLVKEILGLGTLPGE